MSHLACMPSRRAAVALQVPASEFQDSLVWQGVRQGFFFGTGAHGTGYYRLIEAPALVQVPGKESKDSAAAAVKPAPAPGQPPVPSLDACQAAQSKPAAVTGLPPDPVASQQQAAQPPPPVSASASGQPARPSLEAQQGSQGRAIAVQQLNAPARTHVAPVSTASVQRDAAAEPAHSASVQPPAAEAAAKQARVLELPALANQPTLKAQLADDAPEVGICDFAAAVALNLMDTHDLPTWRVCMN